MFRLKPVPFRIRFVAPVEGEGGATPVDGAAPEQDPAPAVESVPGEEALGDPGKKALDAMKAERNAARAEAKARADEIAQLRARIEGKEAEYAAEQAKRATEAAALAKANERILKAEIRAAAAGKLADPADALRYLDPSSFEVGDDGETDAAAIAAAIDDLISTKPYLAAQGRRFQGSGDGGARKETAPSLDELIAQATAAGNHRLAISLKRQKAQTSQTP